MSIFKRISAFMVSLLLILPTVNPASYAADEPELSGDIVSVVNSLPEWIPTDFSEAMEFDAKYGCTHIEGKYVCCVFRMNSEKDNTKNFYSYNPVTYAEDDCCIMSETYFSGISEKPDPSDSTASEEYLAALEKLHISERDAEYADKKLYYTVDVYALEPGTGLDIYWHSGPQNYDPEYSRGTHLSFYSDDDGNITESDIFGWVPDSMTEVYDYISANGMISVKDNYAVYCSVGYSPSLKFSQNGIPQVRDFLSYNISNPQLVPMMGDKVANVILYTASKPGTVTMNFDYSGVSCADESSGRITQSFRFDFDLKPSMINEEECTPLVPCDCNYDGVFGISDVVTLQSWLLGTRDIPKPENADTNKDGVIDVFDLVSMKKLLVKGTGEYTGLAEDPQPMLAIFYDNFAWGRAQDVTFYDENGNMYQMIYNGIRSNNEKNSYDSLVEMREGTEWYNDLLDMMKNENAKKGLMPDEILSKTRNLSKDISKHLNDEFGKNYVSRIDYGEYRIYLIGKDTDGKPVFLNIYCTGDAYGWIDCVEIQNYLKELRYSDLPVEMEFIDMLVKYHSKEY